MSNEIIKAGVWAVIVTAVLARAIALGSINFERFDAALIGYTFATLFAVFGITFRYALWLQRPPTAMYWKLSWTIFFGLFRPRHSGQNLKQLLRMVFIDFMLTRFIWRCSKTRWAAHWFSMWGCLIASAITFPLVFGWVQFKSMPDNLDWYQVHAFGFPGLAFPIHSLFGFLVFHGLVWCSFMVIIGVLLALRRRFRDHGAAALQQFGQDLLPLFRSLPSA